MSVRPAVGTLTAEVYDALPEVYRDADAGQVTGQGYPLLRYLATLLDQLEPITVLLDRFDYTALDERAGIDDGNTFGVGAPWQRYGTGTYGSGTYGDADRSDLVDPAYADAGWLPWLAQLLGVELPAGITVDEQRARMESPDELRAHGTPAAISRETRRQLPPNAYVGITPHFGGDPFAIGVITKRLETATSTTWGELRAIAPTWAHLHTIGSFGNAEAAAPMFVADTERPAGYSLVHGYLD